MTPVVAPAFASTPHSPSEDGQQYSRARLQHDTDAIRNAGVIGVLAEVSTLDGRITARSGVADPTTNQPVSWNSYYRINSTTKSFTAVVALQLVGEGRLKLTDTVDTWLPGLVEGNGNDGKKVTLGHLLRHTSGLPEGADDLPIYQARTAEEFNRERFHAYTPEQVVKMAMQYPPSWIPAPDEQRWAYSSTNYLLAGMIIEKVTGNSWEQEIHDRIIKPLHLRHTFTPGTSAYVPQPRATIYKAIGPGEAPTDVTTYVNGRPDSGIVSTVGDLNQFLRALLGGRLLQPTQLTEMQETVPAVPFQELWRNAGYGLGLMKRQLPCGDWVWFHGGGDLGMTGDNAVTSDGYRSVAVAMSGEPQDEQAALRQLQTSAALIDHALCAP